MITLFLRNKAHIWTRNHTIAQTPNKRPYFFSPLSLSNQLLLISFFITLSLLSLSTITRAGSNFTMTVMMSAPIDVRLSLTLTNDFLSYFTFRVFVSIFFFFMFLIWNSKFFIAIFRFRVSIFRALVIGTMVDPN